MLKQTLYIRHWMPQVNGVGRRNTTICCQQGTVLGSLVFTFSRVCNIWIFSLGASAMNIIFKQCNVVTSNEYLRGFRTAAFLPGKILIFCA